MSPERGVVLTDLGDGWNAHTILESLLVKHFEFEQGVRVVRIPKKKKTLASLNIAVENEFFDMLCLDRESVVYWYSI